MAVTDATSTTMENLTKIHPRTLIHGRIRFGSGSRLRVSHRPSGRNKTPATRYRPPKIVSALKRTANARLTPVHCLLVIVKLSPLSNAPYRPGAPEPPDMEQQQHRDVERSDLVSTKSYAT